MSNSTLRYFATETADVRQRLSLDGRPASKRLRRTTYLFCFLGRERLSLEPGKTVEPAKRRLEIGLFLWPRQRRATHSTDRNNTALDVICGHVLFGAIIDEWGCELPLRERPAWWALIRFYWQPFLACCQIVCCFSFPFDISYASLLLVFLFPRVHHFDRRVSHLALKPTSSRRSRALYCLFFNPPDLSSDSDVTWLHFLYYLIFNNNS